jgi:hypothetical protein
MRSTILLIILLILVAGCIKGQRDDHNAKAAIGDVELQLELATSPEERAHGLMYRDSLGEKNGMLFVFEEKGYHAIWMKNVKFPLDILWLDEGLRVVYIIRDVPPCKSEPCPIYLPRIDAKYVMELPANSTIKHGIEIGDELSLETVYKAP